MLRVVKMLLKGEVGGCALNIHGNYIVDHGKSWKNHGIVFLNFCGNPVKPCIPQPVAGTNFCFSFQRNFSLYLAFVMKTTTTICTGTFTALQLRI